MKFQRNLLLTAALSIVPSALAWDDLTPSDFQLKQGAATDIIADLDGVLSVKSVKEVLADTNHPNPASKPDTTHLITAFTWEDSPNYDDANTKKWYPQGITTSADASDSGKYDEDKVILVSWHSDHYDGGKRGTRISFIDNNDPDNKTYRNALLVIPTRDDDGNPNFKTVAGLHAGGMFWYGDLLYVVETRLGIRVFDMKHIYQVDIGNGNGKVGDEYQAFNYKYVIPQVRTYDWIAKDGMKDLRFSFTALDKTSSPPSITVGEWGTSGPHRLVHWDMDTSSGLLKTDENDVAVSTRALTHDLIKLQGAITINGKYYMTQSTGSLITYSAEDGEKDTSGVFAVVPEDLSYDPELGLWSLMEMPGNRHNVALDHTKF